MVLVEGMPLLVALDVVLAHRVPAVERRSPLPLQNVRRVGAVTYPFTYTCLDMLLRSGCSLLPSRNAARAIRCCSAFVSSSVRYVTPACSSIFLVGVNPTNSG